MARAALPVTVAVVGPRSGLSAAVALTVLIGAGGARAQAAEPVVPLARDAAAERIVDAALASLATRQRESGLFADQTGRLVGGEGLPALAYVALARAKEDGQPPARPADTVVGTEADGSAVLPAAVPVTASRRRRAAIDLSWRLTLARRTLARGSGSSVILRWPLAMLLAEGLEDPLLGQRGELRARVLVWNRLHAAGIAADRCYQDRRCFNNYKLADAVLNLELVRTGLRSPRRGMRLYDPPALRRRALRWLRDALPPQAPASGRVGIPGRGVEPAAILSDPGTWPLPYAALCTAWAVRATRLAGGSAPAALRRTTRAALWGLLGATGPDGGISWSGRGQGQAWTHAASLYAAAAGSALFADTEPRLAARLRRLADVQLDALGARLRDGALQVLPSGNDQLDGLDHYYSVTGSTGLALAFLQMARAELPNPQAPRLGLPAELDGAWFHDERTGLVARRAGLSWIALRERRRHPNDPRSDGGLMRALRLLGGSWREQLPARPGPVATAGRRSPRTPSGGPVLVTAGAHFQPRAARVRQQALGVDLAGGWRAADGRALTGASWRYSAAPDGVALRSVCPFGARLEMTAWLPRRGEARRDGGLLERAGYAVRTRPVPRVRVLVAGYANSVQPRLRAYRLVIPCTGPFASVTFSGGASTGSGAPVPAS
jgi:hypothetical protein